MSEKVDHSFPADDIPDLIKTKEDIDKNMTNEEIPRTEQLHADIRDAASSVPGTEVTSQPGLIQEVIGNIPGTPVSPPA